MTADHLTERAEFYLCLARAFLPPMEERDFLALRQQLAPDLEDLGAKLGYAIGPPVTRLRAALARIGDRQEMLQHYSRLFLVPPVPAHLNGGFYLDGTVMGRSVREIESCYRRFGLVRSPAFHDAPDHLSSLLEFLALIQARAAEAGAADDRAAAGMLRHEAGSFARDYLASWLPALRRDLDKADGGGSPGVYAVLAGILETAVAHDFVSATVPSGRLQSEVPENAGAARPASAPRRCRCCGAAYVAPDEMRDILLSLARAGLGTEHLELCPECRTRSMGLSGMPAPGLKRLRH